ncbi:unnamed protein product [Penicillium salamii]|uniref:Uncharacterized protein n=1 Tax=Penicillium salamii TaxID=1612424 RepID=A0A9W4P0K4_9EURO|nr:unnamed protein product [Penicillium salamii]
MPKQYINIWLPFISLLLWLQTYSLTYGQSASLFQQVRAIESGGSLSLMALYNGPYGISEQINDYKNVILIASGPGLMAVIPYGILNYEIIISLEVSGRDIQGLSTIRDKHGRVLVMVWDLYGMKYEKWFDKTYPKALAWRNWNINRSQH